MNNIAEGFTSELYEIDSDKVLKLYKPAFSAIAETEYAKMLHLQGCGINIPALYGQRVVDGRHGYIMEKIGGRLLSDKLSKDTGDFGGMIGTFVELQRAVNEMTVSDRCFSKQRDVIEARIASNTNIEQTEITILLRIFNAQKSTGLCHNDFHFNNIIVKGKELFVIDWNGAFVGDPLLDVAKTYVVLNFLPFEIGCTEGLEDRRDYIASQYLAKSSESQGFSENEFQVCVLIRIAELTSLQVPAKDSLLMYFERNRHILKEY